MHPWKPYFVRHFWNRGIVLGLALLTGWTAAGTIGFVAIEDWPVADAFYMAVITLSTVGYGEIHPLSPAGRVFASILIIGGLGTAVYTFTRLGQVVLEGELLGGIGRRRMRKETSRLEGHYILCGFGRASKPVAEGLAHKGLDFCVIESDSNQEPHLQDLGYLYLIDDATSDEALQDAGVKRAMAVLTLLPSDADNLYVTVTAKALNPDVRVIARAVDERGEVKLRRGGANEVISPYRLASYRILQAATSPTVLEFMEHIADREDLQMNFGEARVSRQSRMVGMSLGKSGLRDEYGVIVVAIRRDGNMIFSPGPNESLDAEDVLVVLGPEEKLQQMHRELS